MTRVRVCSIPIRRDNDVFGGLDITRKSAKGLGLQFAPTWDMVMGHKGGSLTDEVYTSLYWVILDTVPQTSFDELYQHGLNHSNRLVLQCYCRSGKFCHTILLIKYLCSRYKDKFCII